MSLKFIKHRVTLVICIVAVGIIGGLLIVFSHAATPYDSIEAEKGSLAGLATTAASSSASGGSYVQFGNSTSILNGQLGVSMGTYAFTYEGLTTSEQQTQINNMVADHVKWLRIDADTNLGDLQMIKDAAAKGIDIDIIIEATNPTASTITSAVNVIVPQLKAYASTFEVLNEPNGCAYNLSASNYTVVLKAAYTAIKASDPSSTVISGGLCPNSGSNEPYTYLTAMYAAGVKGYFDAFNDHPYSWPDTPLQTSDSYNPWGYLPELHSIMEANGDGNKLIWLTEFGCPTGSLDDGFPSECSEAAQSDELTDAITQIKTMPYLGPLFYYDWLDSADDFGLYNSNGTAKPVLSVFTKAAEAAN